MMALKKKPMEHSRVEPIGDNQLYYQDVGPQYTFKYDDHQEIVFEELDKLSPRKKRVFLLTYDIHTLKKKRTAKEVAKLM
jgi:DNA-directed RNA polymerase specialized sigma subunit